MILEKGESKVNVLMLGARSKMEPGEPISLKFCIQGSERLRPIRSQEGSIKMKELMIRALPWVRTFIKYLCEN